MLWFESGSFCSDLISDCGENLLCRYYFCAKYKIRTTQNKIFNISTGHFLNVQNITSTGFSIWEFVGFCARTPVDLRALVWQGIFLQWPHLLQWRKHALQIRLCQGYISIVLTAKIGREMWPCVPATNSRGRQSEAGMRLCSTCSFPLQPLHRGSWVHWITVSLKDCPSKLTSRDEAFLLGADGAPSFGVFSSRVSVPSGTSKLCFYSILKLLLFW